MGSISDQQSEDKRLLARADDALAACCDYFTLRFIGFLDERQARVVENHLKASRRAVSWRFFGGYADAQRRILGVFSDGYPADDDAFPIVPVAFHYRCEAILTHRDVLGSLLGCGIVREKVGDIVCEPDKAIVFMHEDLAAYVAEEVDKIGRVGVRAECPYTGEIAVVQQFRPISGTVASARLDAVLKVLLGISREEAARRITQGLVSVDHTPVLSVSAPVKEGAILSVRGSGRFAVDAVSDTTKKGRLIVKARQYV